MGVFEWIGIAEIVGLALLGATLVLVTRRRDRADKGTPSEMAAGATVGTAAVMMPDQPDMSSGFGGGDAGGGV